MGELTSFAITDELFPKFTSEIREIEQNGVSSEVLSRIISKQYKKEQHMKRLYDRYKTGQKGVPIFEREFRQEDQVNNKINNDYFSEIVNTKVGYFAGSPFSYTYSQLETEDNEQTDETAVENAKFNSDLIKDFITYNNVADLDMEITKMAEICGYCGRLLYIDEEGEEAIKLVEPFECVILSKKDMTEPQYAVRYYDIEIPRDGNLETVRKIEFYDDKYIHFYEQGPNGLTVDSDAENPIMEHLFDYCPLQGIPNNREIMGGPEKVLAQIDAIDRTVSDCNSEIEAFKLAYMLIIGARIDEDELDKARDTGAFNLPAFGEGVDIKYLTKNINDGFVENHLNRLDKYIYQFSQTPDMTNPMNENTSGIAMKFRLFPLETRCMLFERKLHSANMYMFKTLASSWRKKAIEFDYLQVIIQYKRTFPLDLSYEADVQGKLKGLVSEQTRLNMASFIDDAEYEMELMDAEASDISPYYTSNDIEGEEETAAEETAAAGEGVVSNGDQLGRLPQEAAEME